MTDVKRPDRQHDRPGDPRPDDAVRALNRELCRQKTEFARLRQIIERINRGFRVDDMLDFMYDAFRDAIPYNRISFATIDETADCVISQWARSDGPPAFPVGYWHRCEDTSLMSLVNDRTPRIINDLEAYVRDKPESDVTRMLVEEGHRASLTCPLVVEGKAMGFLFFDSQVPGVYTAEHAEFFAQIAEIVAVALERGRAVSELAEQKEIIEGENQRHQRELEMARRVQLALIPESLPECPRVSLAVHYQPAEPVGGDLLGVVPFGDSLVVYVADAMGHGVPAALLMSVVHTAFHMAISEAATRSMPDPAALLTGVNRTIIDLFDMNYVTGVCACIEPARERVVMAVAGHPPTIVCRGAERRVERITQGNIPMGVSAATQYKRFELPVGPGDALFFYTDGIVEAMSPARRFYGFDRLEAVLADSCGCEAREVADCVREDLLRHTAGTRLRDDVALLIASLRP